MHNIFRVRQRGAPGPGLTESDRIEFEGLIASAEGAADTFNGFLVPGKNLADPELIRPGRRYSPANSGVIDDASFRSLGFIALEDGKQYTVSGTGSGMTAYVGPDDDQAGPMVLAGVATGGNPFTFTAAAPNLCLWVHLTNGGQNDTTYDGTVQVEQGSAATAYEPYRMVIGDNNVKTLPDKLNASDVLGPWSYNMINPAAVDHTRRYSAASNTLVSNTGFNLSVTARIPVVEGQWYTASGEGIYLPGGGLRGGYFTSLAEAVAVADIEAVTPVSGGGASFRIPVGLGISHIVLTLNKVPDESEIAGEAQLERGRSANTYRPFGLQTKIQESLLPFASQDSGGGGGDVVGFDAEAWYKFTRAEGARLHADKLPSFRQHYTDKDKDVVVVAMGSSVSARTVEHCSTRADAALRPPMLHSNNWSAHVWDDLVSGWEGQQYRRYDAADYFDEAGTFATDFNLDEWDDGAYRNGLTRYSSTASAAVAFTIPADAWQFNFIYRTDGVGCNAQVMVAEGDDHLQVWDEATETWLEANGYPFTMNEPAPVTRTVDIPSPTSSSVTPTVLASKGNTTYQKRLKMRCRGDSSAFDSLGTEKAVTIARTGGGARFMYWGVEWSPRQYMLTFVNASRGSHNVSATSATGLPRYQDNEVWGFRPDLIFSELAINNSGATADGEYARGTWEGHADNYVTRMDYELSLMARAAFFEQDPEYCFWTGVISSNHSMLAANGSLKAVMQPSSTKGPARVGNVLDRYQEALSFLEGEGIPTVDTSRRWIEAARAIYGDLYSATLPSTRTGPTLTNDGTHHNNLGALILGKILCAVLGGVPR